VGRRVWVIIFVLVFCLVSWDYFLHTFYSSSRVTFRMVLAMRYNVNTVHSLLTVMYCNVMKMPMPVPAMVTGDGDW
jgi:hypothetical protein